MILQLVPLIPVAGGNCTFVPPGKGAAMGDGLYDCAAPP